jgi:hypothetical protein
LLGGLSHTTMKRDTLWFIFSLVWEQNAKRFAREEQEKLDSKYRN